MPALVLPVFLALQVQDPQAHGAPQRTVPDPGVIATDQRVTPAGVQSVFRGRVTGVRFGETPGELWVAVPGAAYRLAWAQNRVLARAAFDGRSGVQGLVFDPVAKRALVSSVGTLPPPPPEGRHPGTSLATTTRAVAQLSAVTATDITSAGVASAGTTTGTSATGTPPERGTLTSFGALGDYAVGAPAVARRANAARRRVAVVPLPADDRLAVVDADSAAPITRVPTGVAPIAAVLAADGSVAYVTNFGGPKPTPAERAAGQCCDARAERVRVDARGIAEAGSVSRVDVVTGTVTHAIPVGRHPTGLAWDEPRARLYVANGNSDAVSVIDTRRNAVTATIAVAPFRARRIGLAPTAVALSPDGTTLYVALGGANAVAVYDVLHDPKLKGLIPTGWYPSSLDVSGDGRYLAVGTLLGVGSGARETGGAPGTRARYVHAVRGSVNVIAVPAPAQLAAYTAAVAANNCLTLARGAARDAAARGTATAGTRPDTAPRRGVGPRAVPERPGEPSRVDHVVYVIKENRTYDQVFGDLAKGNGDSSLVMYGRDVTPNHHALAEQFVVLDHFFASGGNSADGHQWLTQANETEYTLWPLYEGRSYPSEGVDPLAYSSGGFLWEAAAARRKTVAVFGEFAPSIPDTAPAARAALLADYRGRRAGRPAYFHDLFRARFRTTSDIPSLDRVLVREYPGWTMNVPDVARAEVFLDHLREWEARRSMPDLVLVLLPSDHTAGTTPGWCTPRACVADNDRALGAIVDGLTHSSFWKRMAIFVVEDDAQNGVDHVDGHRTVALVASPFTRRGAVDTTFYDQPSMVKTIELMLGLPALSLFDLVATDLRASFIEPGEKPDYTPFTALEPRQSLYETNARVGSLRGARRKAALTSLRMRFDAPDAAPSDALNRILWHDAKGWGTRFPGVRRSLFVPMSVDLADDEREERSRKPARR